MILIKGKLIYGDVTVTYEYYDITIIITSYVVLL